MLLKTGRDHRPKHDELIGITNKPLLLHLVGVHIIYIPHEKCQRYKSAVRPNYYKPAELVQAENEQLPSEIHKIINL